MYLPFSYSWNIAMFLSYISKFILLRVTILSLDYTYLLTAFCTMSLSKLWSKVLWYHREKNNFRVFWCLRLANSMQFLNIFIPNSALFLELKQSLTRKAEYIFIRFLKTRCILFNPAWKNLSFEDFSEISDSEVNFLRIFSSYLTLSSWDFSSEELNSLKYFFSSYKTLLSRS